MLESPNINPSINTLMLNAQQFKNTFKKIPDNKTSKFIFFVFKTFDDLSKNPKAQQFKDIEGTTKVYAKSSTILNDDNLSPSTKFPKLYIFFSIKSTKIFD